MKVYDFDGTIYDGDSTVDFYKHCLSHYPQARKAVLRAVWGAILYMFGIIGKTAFKERFFSFLRFVSNVDDAVAAFWDTHESKLKPWYLKQKHDSNIIVSASPEFLLSPVCRRLGVRLIGSRVDKLTGKFVGENIHGEEKLTRLTAEINIADCTAFYSDSITDKPLADAIPNSFMVRGDRLIPWGEYKSSTLSRAKHTFLTPEFFVFVFCGGCGTAVNFCLSLLFSQRIDPTLAYAGGYAVSLFVTYTLNSVLIWKQRLTIGQFVRFVISYIPNFLILFAFVALLINIFHLWKIIVYLAAALFGLPITFVLVKLFAFRGKSSEG